MIVEEFSGDLEEFIDLFHESTGLDDVEAVRKLIAIEVLKGTRYGVVREAGAIAGMVGVYIDPVVGVRGLEPAQIIDFAVHADFRGRGMGRVLMDWAVGLARDAGEPWLWLYTGSRSDAVAVYEKLGFERSGVNENFWGGEGSRVWFRKKIDSVIA